MKQFGAKKQEKLKKKEEQQKAEKAKLAEKIKREKQIEEQAIAKENHYYMWLRAIFGGILFLGSSASIYFLVKYKKNFMHPK